MLLHLRVVTHAGALWRDEISSLRLANAIGTREFWSCFGTDVFPPFYFLVLRCWVFLGLGFSDIAFRYFGFGIGVALIAAIWITAYGKRRSTPLWPLALLALTPLTFQCGDQLRPYGLAGIFVILAFGAIWRVTFSDEFSKSAAIIAGLCTVLAVQTSYSNSLLIFAICTAGIFASLRSGFSKRAMIILLIGIIAALSLAPYLFLFRGSHEWMALLPGSPSLWNAIGTLGVAAALGHPLTLIVWVLLPIIGLAAFTVPSLRRKIRVAETPAAAELQFAFVTFAVALLVTLTFFRWVNWLSYPRYFFLLLCVNAICLHRFAEVLRTRVVWRSINLFAAIVVAAMQLPNSYYDSSVRLTNCDVAAESVGERASPDDVVVLTAFYYGINFERYYHGSAPWTSLPPIADYRWYRWDLAMQAMARPDPIREVVSRCEIALRSGHRVFLVGSLRNRPPQTPPTPLPPAPNVSTGWDLPPYLKSWQDELGYFIEQHSTSGERIPLEENQAVNEIDRVGVFAVSGWR